MPKFCSKCGVQAVDGTSLFCKNCGTQLPESLHEVETNDRSFKYSLLFKFVIYTDLFLCFIFCVIFFVVIIGGFLEGTSQGYQTANIYVFVALLANFIVDMWLLKNKKQTPNTIDITICWIKGILGIIGIITIISGAYFIINSMNMHNSYNDYITKRKNEDWAKAKIQETEDNIKKLEESGNIVLVDNYAKVYSNYLSGTKEFNNLKELLATKKYYFENNALELIIHHRRIFQKYSEIKQKILEMHPNNSDECILYYLEVVEDNNEQINESMIRAILIEQFNYQGDINKDIIRISKENELKKFESNLISGTPPGTRITIDHINSISGYDFEIVLGILFEKMG